MVLWTDLRKWVREKQRIMNSRPAWNMAKSCLKESRVGIRMTQ